MRKKKQKKNNAQLIECNSNHMSQEKMIEIQAEAYYRALKRIEDEKSKEDEQKLAKKKYAWYEAILFVLNVLLCPFKISKKFTINNQAYDSVLVMVVSGILEVIGFILWLVGMSGFMFGIWQIFIIGITYNLIIVCCITIFSLLFGSVFLLAGREFEKETDSNKIYAYSASIIAIISCVVSIISLIEMYW